jgi:hypothetical protein
MIKRRLFLNLLTNRKLLQYQAPHSWGFLFVGCWLDLGMRRYLSLLLFTGLAWGQEKVLNEIAKCAALILKTNMEN